jgi:hypothetical protein
MPLKPTPEVAALLARLYLASGIGDLEAILDMANGNDPTDIVVPAGSLDEDVKKVIKSQPRFRTALSEHLAFWIRLATTAQCPEDCSRFACSLPNVQPEDKGPDGLFLSTGTTSRVEIQSVKNSIGNPQSLISTKRFRLKGTLSVYKKLLEDFHRFAHENFGFVRLERLLADLCRLLHISTDRQIRIALLSNTECSYNAIVVADQQYADVELFQGYQYVTPEAKRRVATYIGSTKWTEVAEQTRRSVLQILEQTGFL